MRSFCSLVSSPRKVARNGALSDAILAVHDGGSSVDGLFPYFVEHTKEAHPLLFVMKSLKIVSDLTNPSNWLVIILGKGEGSISWNYIQNNRTLI